MLLVWSSPEGIIPYDFVSDDYLVDFNRYFEPLEGIYTIGHRKYTVLANGGRNLQQQDNARRLTDRKICNKFHELEVIELLPHPAHSPVLAPSDHYLFRSITSLLRLQHLKKDKVEASVKEFLVFKINKRGIKEQVER